MTKNTMTYPDAVRDEPLSRRTTVYCPYFMREECAGGRKNVRCEYPDYTECNTYKTLENLRRMAEVGLDSALKAKEVNLR